MVFHRTPTSKQKGGTKKLYPELPSPKIRRCEEQEDEEMDPTVPNESIGATSTPIYGSKITTETELRQRDISASGLSPIVAGNFANINQTDTFGDSAFQNGFGDVPRDNYFDQWRMGAADFLKLKDYWFTILCGVLAVLVLWCVLITFNANPNKQNLVKPYVQGLKSIKKDVPSLSKYDLQLLQFVGRQWLVDQHEQPIVVTIGGPSAETVAIKLLELTAKVVGQKQGGKAFTGSPDLHRGPFHSRLLKELRAGSAHGPVVFGVTSVEKMVWDTPLVLQAFSDCDKILATNALIILSVNLPDVVNRETCDERLQNELTERWKSSGGTVDNISPILSRILGFTICV